MLKVGGVTKEFGGLRAIDSVDFTVDPGEIVGLIGPNGAGKTTLFNTITGILAPEPGGVIEFRGLDLLGMDTHQIARNGVIRTFQIVRVFDEMSVLDNAAAGALFGSGGSVSRSESQERGHQALEFIGLGEKADLEVSSLTIAQKKQLELARALAADPQLVLLDEIASGLTPGEIEVLTETIRRIRDERGISVFWIEHIMEAIMGVADRVIVLNSGRKIAENTPGVIREDATVVEAYLGQEA